MPRSIRPPRRLALALVAAASTASAATPALAAELGQRCTNPDEGYVVGYPETWLTNDRVEAGALPDVSACRFFGPEPFEVRPASGIGGVGITITTRADDPPAGGRPTTVDGRPAQAVETVAAEDGLEPAGTRSYQVWIEDGTEWLVLTTSDGPTWVGGYEQNRTVLDAMAGSLDFEDRSLPDTAVPARPPMLGWVSGAVVAAILLALGGVRAGRRG